MRIGLDLWSAPGMWWPPGASYAADFVANRYMRGGEAASAAQAYGLVRASPKFAADSSGSFVLFGSNVPARTDRGLSVEPASSNLLTNPVRLDQWMTMLATATPQAGPVLGIFTHPMLVTDTSGNVVARLRHQATQEVVADQTYALSFWARKGSVSHMGVIASGNGGSSRLSISLPSGEVTNFSNARGTAALSAVVQPAPDTYCAQVLWTPNFSGTCEVAIGPGTSTHGDNVIALGAFMEPGTAFSSPMIGEGVPSARAADELTLFLPVGTHDLTFTFDNGSSQVIGDASGVFAVSSLERAAIRTIVGTPS